MPPQCYSDGSVENDLPMKQLSELFNVNHFIVSQVNPHSAMLSSLTLQDSVWSPPLYGAIVSYVKFLRHQCRDWLKNVVHLMTSRSLSPQWSIKRGISQALVQVCISILLSRFLSDSHCFSRSMKGVLTILQFSLG